MKIGDSLLSIGGSTNEIEADHVYKDSLSIRQALVASEPTNADHRRALALSYERLGSLEQRFGHPEKALEHFSFALMICQKLALSNPENVVAQRDLAITHQWVGDAQLELNELDRASVAFGTSLEIRRTLASQNPSNQAQRDLAVSLGRMGDAMMKVDNRPEAARWYKQSLQIRERLVAEDSSNSVWQNDLIIDLRRSALAGDEPRSHLSRALALAQQLQARGQLRGDQTGWVDALQRALDQAPR